jgi:hypothetical protein
MTVFPAIYVQLRAEAARPVELQHPKVCIACARMRLARICADDARDMLVAERLVGEARQRRARKMDQRERVMTGVSACAYLAVAVAIAAFVPDERHVEPVVALGLLLGYALILQVRFEFGGYYASPEQLAFIPLLLIAPLPYVPRTSSATAGTAIAGSTHSRIHGRPSEASLSSRPWPLVTWTAPTSPSTWRPLQLTS